MSDPRALDLLMRMAEHLGMQHPRLDEPADESVSTLDSVIVEQTRAVPPAPVLPSAVRAGAQFDDNLWRVLRVHNSAEVETVDEDNRRSSFTGLPAVSRDIVDS